MKKKIIAFFSCLIVSSLILIGCTGPEVIEKVKDPIKKTYVVISKLIPVLNDLKASQNVPDKIKSDLEIATNALTVVQTTLGYAAKILGIQLDVTTLSVADIEALKQAIVELEEINKKAN
jgi:hypothetical protein